MKTFTDLFNFIVSLKDETIYSFLEDNNDIWNGKEKQESLYRLFAYLRLIEEFNQYDLTDGNFNEGTISKNCDKSLLFNKCLNDKCDKSDLTLLNNNSIIASSSKNKTNYGINDLDIDNIQNIYNDLYKHKYKLQLCIIIKDKEILYDKIKHSNKSSKRLCDILNDKTTIIFDWKDINLWYNNCKNIYKNKTIDDIIKVEKIPLVNRFHQEISIINTIEIAKKYNNILWGHIPRSGKSYIMAGLIANTNKNNYLIITTAPNETKEQYLKMFNLYSQFNNYNIIYLDGKDKKPNLSIKNIIICSKQYLQTKGVKEDKINQIKWLKDIKFDWRFIDESHNGGTTKLAQKIFTTYGIGAITIYITATYLKPLNTYNIPNDAWVLWDIEDVKLCKTIDNLLSLERLCIKYGNIINTVYNKYTSYHIINEYSKYPNIELLSWDFKDNVKDAIIEKYQNTNKGFSTDAIFLLKTNNKETILEFQDEEGVINLLYTIFGNNKKDELFTTKDEDSILYRIENICKKNNSRWFSKEEPLTILAFLPCGLSGSPIDKLQETLYNLIKKYKLLEDYDVIYINSKYNNNKTGIEIIEDARKRVKLNNKKGLLVLSGYMCSMAVSINHCDIVLMLNNVENMDTYLQMMFRSMTEAYNKKIGFVIDLNLHRVCNVITDYALKITKNKNTKQSIKYVLEQNLIGFNSDKWMQNYFNLTKLDDIVEKIYNIYISKPCNAIENILKSLEIKVKLQSTDQELFNKVFTTSSSSKKTKIDELIKNEDINKGIDKHKYEKEKDDVIDDNDSKKIIKNVNLINDIMKHLIPLLCILTIHNKDINTFGEICIWIKNNKIEYDIIINQLSIWWGGNLTKSIDIISLFNDIYNRYLIDNDMFNTVFMRLKEVFSNAVNNKGELSIIIDKYLIPHEIEKKQNAEVSTPYQLRQDMLNKIPEDFWMTPKKVFEPCCGKGGFLLDIIDKFMQGLKELVPDEEERYRLVIEECIYWSEYNPTNVYICKLLLDPYEKYKLNYNEGDTLKLDISKKWGIEGFEAVIGNPPYQPISNGKKGGKSIWPEFVEYGINNIIKEGYLVYVHPALWRKPNNIIWNKMIENKFHYISIHNDIDGNKYFNATTRYDWYILQKTNKNIITTILEEDKNEYKCVLDNNSFIPNFGNSIFNKVRSKIIIDGFLYAESDSMCHSSRNYINIEKDKEYKYEIINAISNKNGIRYLYSSKKHPYQDNKKVIFSNGRIIQPIYDDGKYGTSQGGIYIIVKDDNEGNNIVKYLKSKLVSYLIKSTKWSNFETCKQVFYNIAHPKNIGDLTDENIYKYFNLTDEEIKNIENIV